MIDPRLIKLNAPHNIGEQIHVNHEGCSAGEDHKKRLYIKKVSGGLLAYCHHCNEHSFLKSFDRSGEDLRKWLHGELDTLVAVENEEDIVVPYTSDISMDGKNWLSKHWAKPHLEYFASEMYGSGVLMGRAREGHIILKLKGVQGELIGFQKKNFSCFPKYETKYYPIAGRGDASWFRKGAQSLIITEDYLSAYRVWQDTSFDSVALLRTTVSDTTVRHLCDAKYHNIYVWLDPDGAGVDASIDIRGRLSIACSSTTVNLTHESRPEPKNLTNDELSTFVAIKLR
jgi:hypothetical protein